MNATIMWSSSLLKYSTKLFTAGVGSMAARKMVMWCSSSPHRFSECSPYSATSQHCDMVHPSIELHFTLGKIFEFPMAKSTVCPLKIYKLHYYIHAFGTLWIEFRTKWQVADYAMIGFGFISKSWAAKPFSLPTMLGAPSVTNKEILFSSGIPCSSKMNSQHLNVLTSCSTILPGSGMSAKSSSRNAFPSRKHTKTEVNHITSKNLLYKCSPIWTILSITFF